MYGNKNKQNKGFTLIELLVVISIIALLSSVALIATMQARQKSRDVKRLGDMTQMNNALELFFASYRGYPSGTGGVPTGLEAEGILTGIPVAPSPSDGACENLPHSTACSNSDPSCSGIPANTYYYIPSGTAVQTLPGGPFVYQDYSYYFCLGNQTGNFGGGERVLNPKGLK